MDAAFGDEMTMSIFSDENAWKLHFPEKCDIFTLVSTMMTKRLKITQRDTLVKPRGVYLHESIRILWILFHFSYNFC